MNPGRQRGLTLFALFAVLVPLVLLAILAMRVIPVYYEHQRIQRILGAMADSGQLADASERELRASFDRRAQVDDVHSVLPDDLVIESVPGGKAVHVNYSARVPVIEHVTLVFDLSASAAPPGGKP